MNNYLLLCSIFGTFCILLCVKKYFGKEGIIGWMGIASILANLILSKNVDLFGIGATLGNVLFASNFLATDILTENYGYINAKKGVKFAIFSILFFMITTQVALLYIPNNCDVVHDSLKILFEFTPRISFASIIMFILSNVVNIKLYEFIRTKSKGKHMWFRNNFCTIVCNGFENFIFYIISFSGIFDIATILRMGISATIIEILIALCDTPFLYMSKKI